MLYCSFRTYSSTILRGHIFKIFRNLEAFISEYFFVTTCTVIYVSISTTRVVLSKGLIIKISKFCQNVYLLLLQMILQRHVIILPLSMQSFRYYPLSATNKEMSSWYYMHSDISSKLKYVITLLCYHQELPSRVNLCKNVLVYILIIFLSDVICTYITPLFIISPFFLSVKCNY